MTLVAMLAERGSWLAIVAWLLIGVWGVALAAWVLKRRSR